MRYLSDLYQRFVQRRRVPKPIVEQYLRGDCMWLAVAMNRRWGLQIETQIWGLFSDIPMVAHAYCILPDRKKIDILGPQHRIISVANDRMQWKSKDLLKTMSNDQTEIDHKLHLADQVIDRYISPYLDQIPSVY